MGVLYAGFNVTEETGESQFIENPDALNLTGGGGGINVDFVVGAFDGYSGVANVNLDPTPFTREMYDNFQQEMAGKQTEKSPTPIHVELSAHNFDGYGGLGNDVFSVYAVGISSVYGGAGNDDLRIAGTGTAYLHGGDGDDYLSTGDSNDILLGGYGADSMIGGLGDDTYYVDNADDKVVELSDGGTDEVVSTVSWELGANVETLHLGNQDAINGSGNALDNVIEGNDADNVLDGAAGADTLVGHGGNDTYWVDNAADVVIEAANGGADRLIASSSYVLAAGQSVERLDASLNVLKVGAMDLTGNEIDQDLVGNNSENRLDGGGGADTLIGNYGDDTYVVDDARVVVVEGDDAGTDNLLASVSYVLAAGQSIEVMKATSGTAAIDLAGNEFAQSIEGNAGDNMLQGNGASDTIIGGAGIDTACYAGKASDYSYVTNGDGSYSVTDIRADAIDGTDLLTGIEELSFSDGSVLLAGNTPPIDITLSKQVIAENAKIGAVVGTLSAVDAEGDEIAWSLAGGGGKFGLVEHDGEFMVTVAGSLDYETRSAYNIRLTASDEESETVKTLTITIKDVVDRLTGDAGNNRLQGGDGADIIRGLAGDDTLKGGDGADTLDGGRGDDVLTGGADGDHFIFGTRHGNDRITDFTGKGSNHDVMDLSASGVASYRDLVHHHLKDVGHDLQITVADGSKLILAGLDQHDIVRADFLF